MGIVVKRVYERAVCTDGYRVLVDRLWPRGVAREALPMDLWAKELAPSSALRQWFGHDVDRWDSFRHRYAAELDTLADHWHPLAERGARHPVTLLYGARDEEHNNARVLKEYLEHWLRSHGPR